MIGSREKRDSDKPRAFLKREEYSIRLSIPWQEFKKQLIVLFLLEKSMNMFIITILVINILTSTDLQSCGGFVAGDNTATATC